MKKILLTLAATAVLSSCGLYKNYERPADVVTDNLYRADANTQDTLGLAAYSWRELFTDPQLQQLIERGLQQNTNLRSTMLQIEQAEAALKVAKWAYIPSMAFTPQGTLSGRDWGKAMQSYTLPVSASWQFEQFGTLRNAKKRAQMQLLNSKAYQQAVHAQLVAAIANYYYSLATLKTQLDICYSTERLWAENVKVTKALMAAGQSNMAGVAQTEANYYSVCTQISDLKQQISDLEDDFSALLGEAPQKYEINTLDSWKRPAQLSAGVPAVALSNRPDVKMAESQLAAAFYMTNQSRAAFYPGLSLTGTLGWSNSAGTMVLNPGKFIYSAVASITQPLFQNGRIIAQYKISKSQQEQAKLTFQQKLLDAGAEVNAALTKIETTNEKAGLYQKQVAASQTALTSTQELMKNSSTNYLQVLTAQQVLLTAQMAEVSNKLSQIQAVIELYQALGGGQD